MCAYSSLTYQKNSSIRKRPRQFGFGSVGKTAIEFLGNQKLRVMFYKKMFTFGALTIGHFGNDARKPYSQKNKQSFCFDRYDCTSGSKKKKRLILRVTRIGTH